MITKTLNPEQGWVYFDSKGIRMPWYTLPCLEWLDGLELKGKCVFEYGLGYSTQWYLSRGAYCFGVESNLDWVPELNLRSMSMFARDKEGYVTAINNQLSSTNIFDIICIDGIYRDECTEYALKRLAKGGYLIVDNFEQPSVQADWPKTRELTKDLPLTIYKQPDHYDWQTAVWINT